MVSYWNGDTQDAASAAGLWKQQQIYDHTHPTGSAGFGTGASRPSGFSQDEGEELQQQQHLFLFMTTDAEPKTADGFSGEFCHFPPPHPPGSESVPERLTDDEDEDGVEPQGAEHTQLRGPRGPGMLQLHIGLVGGRQCLFIWTERERETGDGTGPQPAHT